MRPNILAGLAGLMLGVPAAAQTTAPAPPSAPAAAMPAVGAAAPSAAAAPAQASSSAAMPGMASPAGPSGAAASPEVAANRTAMVRMQHAMMAAPVTGEADRDFVGGMVPHHEGAIAMAQVELRYGHDPALRALARRIVIDQRREVGEMRRWQTAHPGR